jgi:hypothetical protein
MIIHFEEIWMLILNHDIISHVASMSRVLQSWTFINHLVNHEFNHHSSSIRIDVFIEITFDVTNWDEFTKFFLYIKWIFSMID